MSKYLIEGIEFTTETENEIEKESLSLKQGGEVIELDLRLSFTSEVSPSVYRISWAEDQIDMIGIWTACDWYSKNITPDWSKRRANSRLASGMPLLSVYSKTDENRVSIALSDPKNPTTIMAGAVEETGKIAFEIDLFSQKCSKMKEYEITIRIDKRHIPFYKAIKSVREWWQTLGYTYPHVPKEAQMPMYSAWYSFHQRLDPEALIRECRIAKECGMDSIIVDDGWQTDDNSRGYGYCGDWKVCERKIPDMKGLVDRVHQLGMKFIIWFSVPFVGFDSENYERFKGMYLSTNPKSRASALDPRFKEVRDFLEGIYVDGVLKYGWDGLKLDFIDSFTLCDESPMNYEMMDTVSVEEGVDKLLSQVTKRLKEINPEFLIEFRQSYVGPVISKYGNMLRATDCPNDALSNKLNTLSLRLTSGKAAVHSDMLMWSKNDTLESVAYQLLAIMFSVPQISIRFDSITTEQRELLKDFLTFWRAHSDTIMNGEIIILEPWADFSTAKAINKNEAITVLYGNNSEKAEYGITSYIFNSTGKGHIYLEADTERTYDIIDYKENIKKSGKIPVGVSKIDLLPTECLRVNK